MKTLKYLTLFLFSFLQSCSGADDTVIPENIIPELVVSHNSLLFEAKSPANSIDITSNAVWRIKNTSTWCKTSIETTKGSTKVSISVDDNTSELERKTILLVSSIGIEDIAITVTQKGKELVIAKPDYIEADKTGMLNNAKELASKMILGWNLGNSLESCDATSAGETMWGNPKVSKTLIDAVKSAGFNVIRIPCAWNGYIEDQTTYKIKDSWLARVQEVVDYCVDNDMYVILNIHWDGGWLENNPTYAKQEAVNKKQKALWKQIAIHFRDYDEHLLFAGTNEVHKDYNTPSSENIIVQLSYNQIFVDAVRDTGGRNAWRNLIVQAYNTNIDYAISYLKMPTDKTFDRLMAEVHFYDPYDFTLQDNGTYKTQWGKYFVGGDVSSWGQEAWVDEAFGKMKLNFVDKGIPVILGEYGAILRTSLSEMVQPKHIEARNYYLNYVTKAAKSNGLIPVYWDNGNSGNNGFGLFNRTTGNITHNNALNALISGVK